VTMEQWHDAKTYAVTNGSVTGRDGVVIPIRDYVPAMETTSSPFLWIHGGGFAGGGLDQKESDAPARYLAASGRRVRTVDYRLVPVPSLFRDQKPRPSANRYPAALHDVIDVAQDLSTVTGGPIAMGGASAGANLAAAAAMMSRDEGTLDLLALVYVYGAFHFAVPDNPQIESELRGPLVKWMFNPKMAHRICLNYVGDPALMAPGYAFPAGADVHALPPSLLLNSENDRLRSSGEVFADELRAAGVDVHEETVPGARHGFLNAFRKPRFAEELSKIENWLAAHDQAAAHA
jgi:acetyl esterase/lipase